MYDERPSSLHGAVVWSRTADDGCRVVPDGCMDLIWHDGALVVAGPDTKAHVASATAGTVTGLRFPPGVGPSVVGVPASELRDERVDLDDIWAAPVVRRLSDALSRSGDGGCVLEAFSSARLRDLPTLPSLPATIVRRLHDGHRVSAVAAAIGLSERQLHRRCLTAFGYGPKMLARVLRLRAALRIAGAGMPFAAVAAEAGYADQAHMTREVRALAGASLRELTS